MAAVDPTATTLPLRARDDNAPAPKGLIATPPPVEQPTAASPGATERVAHLPHHVPEYAHEIIDHLMMRERKLQRDPDYLSRQPDVSERMRTILVDWLVDVHLKFKLHPETFFLAVDYVDRYLMATRAARATLQLVGICAVLIAAKHEEIWPPEVRECIYISANTYSREEILVMERDIASTLSFRLCVPTPFPFMTRVLDCTSATEDARLLAAYCLDMAALEYKCLQFLPSCIGFASVLIANCVIENTRRQSNAEAPIAAPLAGDDLATVWDDEHAYYSKTPNAGLDAVIECARCILSCAAAVNVPNSRYHAVQRKFSQDRFSEIATRYTLPATL